MGAKPQSQEDGLEEWLIEEHKRRPWRIAPPPNYYYALRTVVVSTLIGAVAGALLSAVLLGYIWPDAPHGWDCAEGDFDCWRACYEERGFLICHAEARMSP